MNTFNHNIAIFYALLQRDLKVLKKRLHNLIIDGLILVYVTVLIFGYLLQILYLQTHILQNQILIIQLHHLEIL